MINASLKEEIENMSKRFVEYLDPIMRFEERYSELSLMKILPELELFFESINQTFSDRFGDLISLSLSNKKVSSKSSDGCVELARPISINFKNSQYFSEILFIVRILKTTPPSGPFAFGQIGEPYYWSFNYRGNEIGQRDTFVNRNYDIQLALFEVCKVLTDEVINIVVHNGTGAQK